MQNKSLGCEISAVTLHYVRTRFNFWQVTRIIMIIVRPTQRTSGGDSKMVNFNHVIHTNFKRLVGDLWERKLEQFLKADN